MNLVFLSNATENADGFRHAWLVDNDLSKPTLESGIRFDILSVFGKSSGTDTPEFS